MCDCCPAEISEADLTDPQSLLEWCDLIRVIPDAELEAVEGMLGNLLFCGAIGTVVICFDITQNGLATKLDLCIGTLTQVQPASVQARA